MIFREIGYGSADFRRKCSPRRDCAKAAGLEAGRQRPGRSAASFRSPRITTSRSTNRTRYDARSKTISLHPCTTGLRRASGCRCGQQNRIAGINLLEVQEGYAGPANIRNARRACCWTSVGSRPSALRNRAVVRDFITTHPSPASGLGGVRRALRQPIWTARPATVWKDCRQRSSAAIPLRARLRRACPALLRGNAAAFSNAC